MYFSYDEYIYTIGDYLVDLLLLTSVIVFFSVVIKNFFLVYRYQVVKNKKKEF